MVIPQIAYLGLISLLEKNLEKLSQIESSLKTLKRELPHQDIDKMDIIEYSQLIKNVEICLQNTSNIIDQTTRAQNTIYVNGELGLIKLAAYTAAVSSFFMFCFLIYGLLT